MFIVFLTPYVLDVHSHVWHMGLVRSQVVYKNYLLAFSTVMNIFIRFLLILVILKWSWMQYGVTHLGRHTFG